MIIIGTICGSFCAGIQSQVFGRKITVLTTMVLYIIGISSLRFGPHHAFLFIGQFIMGFAGSSVACVVPVYTSELSEPKFRRLSGTFFTTFFSIGGALLFLFTALFDVENALIITLIMAIVNFVLVMICPKSPTWLVSKGRTQEALDLLETMRGSTFVAMEEFQRLEENKNKQESVGTSQEQENTFRRLFQNIKQPTFLKPLFVLHILFVFGLNLSGATAMPIYFIPFIEETGVSNILHPYWAASSLTLWRVLINILTTVVASRVKRRPLYMTAASVVCLGWLLTGLNTYLQISGKYQDYDHVIQWVTYFSLALTMTGYACGYVMVTFMLLGELLPSNVRGIGTGAVMFSNNIAWFLIGLLFPMLKSTFGMDGTFFLFSAVSLFVLLFAYFFIPETFNVTLENIENYYRIK